MHQVLKLILEGNSTSFGQFLCPSSGVFHCTHSDGICHIGLLTACKQDQDVPSWSCSKAVSKPVWHTRKPLLCAQWKTPDDGQRNCPKYVVSFQNKFEKLVHLSDDGHRNSPKYVVSFQNKFEKLVHFPDDGHRNCPKYVVSFQNKFEKMVHLVGIL